MTRADPDLVSLARCGDMWAYSELYRAHEPVVANVVRRHVSDPHAVADVVQEVFTRALDQLATLRDESRFRSWLLSIAKFAAIDRGRMERRVIALDDGEAESLPSSDTPPDELAELGELARVLRACISGLSKRDATALTLVTDFGFGPDDVADALGVTPGTAKVVVHRARQRLRDAVSLQLAAGVALSACGELGRLREAARPSVVARHLRQCEQCDRSLRAEVHAYGFEVEAGLEP